VDNHHYYLHISGEPVKGNPNFAETGAAPDGPLKYRPAHYVPIQVPLFDEEATNVRKEAYKAALEAGAANLTQPEPAYQWFYRPEMQFSVFDLDKESMQINVTDSNNELYNILEEELPVLSSTTDQLDFFYSLVADDLPVLETFGPGRVIVFGIGDHEIQAIVGPENELIFQGLEDVNLLDAEDFLAVRLYQNGDDANILWEFAFAQLSLLPSDSGQGDEIEISADDTQTIVHALVLDGLYGDEAEPHTVYWSIEGSGSVSPSQETNAEGSFSTYLTLPTTAGSTARVSVQLGDKSARTLEQTPLYRVVPGKPASIEIETSGETAIGELGGIDLTLTIRDQFGNLVADGTPVGIDVPDVHVEAAEGTTDGRLQATVTGFNRAGTKEMVISCGSVQVSQQISVHDIAFNWTVPTNIRIHQTIPVTLTATSTYGDLTGLQVYVSAFRGRLKDHVLTLGSNGEASTQYYTGQFRGNAQLYARVGATADYRAHYVEDDTTEAILSETVIVSDETSNGSFDVSTDYMGVIPVAYNAETTLEVTGVPGATQAVTIGSLGEPLKEPILRYPMKTIDSAGLVIDTFQGIDGEGVNVNTVLDYPNGFDTSYEFTNNSTIRVPLDGTLNKEDNIGIGLWFKPSASNSTIVNYAVRNLTLTLDSANQLTFTAHTTDGTFSVNSGVLSLHQWHQVGAAMKDGLLLLEVDGQRYQTAVSGMLVEDQGAAHALIIGDNFQGRMSDFRVNDWANPLIIATQDGNDQADVTIGADGKGYLTIRSTGQVTSCEERNRRRMERFYARMGHKGLFPQAFAAPLPAFCNESVPKFESRIEVYSYAIDYLDKCILADRIEKVRIRVQQANGFKDKYLAYMQLAQLKSLHVVLLAARANVSLMSCAEGFVTGGNQSVGGMVCDFVSGMLAWGDVRDWAIHSFHFYWGDQSKYDEATHALAGLGVITNLLQVGGFFAAVAPGVALTAVDGAVAGTKMAVKVMRRGGQLSKYMKIMVDYLSKNVMEVDDNLQRAKVLVKLLPVLEITAAIYFYQDEFADVGELLMDMVQTEGAFLNLVNYAYGYLEWLDQQSTTTGNLRDFRLIDEAYAVIPIRASVRKVLNNLKAYKNFVESLGIEGSEKIGEILAKTISEIEIAKKTNRISYGMDQELIESIYTDKVMKAFIAAGSITKGAAAKLRTFLGSRITDQFNLFEELADMPPEFMFNHKDKLMKVFNFFDTYHKIPDWNDHKFRIAYNKAQGAAQEIHFLYKALKSGKQVLDIQVEKVFKIGGKDVKRVYDAEIIDNGKTILYDSKSWSKNLKTVRSYINNGFDGKLSSDDNKPGQLFKDIVYMAQKEDFSIIRYALDSRNADNAAAIRKMIVKGVEKRKDKFRTALDFQTTEQWNKFIKDLKAGMMDFIEIVPK
jgi:hypothetical protein